jgi:hypothetical protein
MCNEKETEADLAARLAITEDRRKVIEALLVKAYKTIVELRQELQRIQEK